MRSPMRMLTVIFTAVLAATTVAAANLPAPRWESEQAVATEGYYTLHWSLPRDDDLIGEGFVFELAEAPRPDPAAQQPIYRGPDLASTQSGKPNGNYFYRIRVMNPDTGEAGPWSRFQLVEVEHHALPKAFIFLAIGAIVFAATAATILIGDRRENAEAKGAAH